MFDGWINLIKPAAVSSSFALKSLRSFFKNKKRVGHIGTLDPFASGVLPVAIGEATKTIEYLNNFKKTYIADIKWGYKTDTLDGTGNIVEKSHKIPTKDEIKSVLDQFIGEIEQIPPKFSANKIDGVRAYKLARQNRDFEMKPKKVKCYDLKLIHHDEDGVSQLEITCGRGFYIRSLGRDIAEKMSALGTVTALRRVRDGIFFEKNGIMLDLLKNILHNNPEKLKRYITPTANVLDDILVIAVDWGSAVCLKNGLLIDIPHGVSGVNIDQADFIQVMYEGELVAICIVFERKLKPVKVFNLIDW